MVFNYGPRKAVIEENIIFNAGTGGGKFKPTRDLLIDNNNISTTGGEGYNLYENSEGWVLWIYKPCNLKLKKKIKQCDISICGGGGHGGKYQSKQNGLNTGGGGGSGGKINNFLTQNFESGEYQIICGEGSSTELKNNNESIFSAGVGADGNNQTKGTKDGCSSGGQGGSGSGTADSGDAGQQIFNGTSVFSNLKISIEQSNGTIKEIQPDIIKIGAGGAGGAGVNSVGGGEDAGTDGQPGDCDFEYGQGGKGGNGSTKDGFPGKIGIFIIRQKY